jgi:uncharacterized protein with von Willebrand factor type A (vWA) domain
VLVSREQDRLVFRELFDAFFRDPGMAHKLLAQMLPARRGQAEPVKRGRACARRWRRPRLRQPPSARSPTRKCEFDAAMTASELQRLKHADFNALSARSTAWSSGSRAMSRCRCPPCRCAARGRARAARSLHWPAPCTRRRAPAASCWCCRGAAPAPAAAAAGAGRRVRLDGALCAPAAGLPACGHPRTQPHRRDVFAFGTHLTDLTPAFRIADTDEMLVAAGHAIDDFAGGTRWALRWPPCASSMRAGWWAAARWCC